MLPAKRNTNDSNAQQQPKHHMYDSGIQSAAKQPDDIADKGKAAAVCRTAGHFFAKGPKHQAGQFKTLQPPGNTHHGNAQCQPAKQITQGCKKAAEDKPDEVAQ